MCVPYVHINAGVLRRSEKGAGALGLGLELELEAVVNHLTWVLGTKLQSSDRAAATSEPSLQHSYFHPFICPSIRPQETVNLSGISPWEKEKAGAWHWLPRKRFHTEQPTLLERLRQGHESLVGRDYALIRTI